ncbi:MAG: hypothetical protein J3Q66DRAFT_368608 [Benniella sp.]|nr:MAG: hypothetical protein J3Q66DRAFT_368608 [Benniella sp.]
MSRVELKGQRNKIFAPLFLLLRSLLSATTASSHTHISVGHHQVLLRDGEGTLQIGCCLPPFNENSSSSDLSPHVLFFPWTVHKPEACSTTAKDTNKPWCLNCVRALVQLDSLGSQSSVLEANVLQHTRQPQNRESVADSEERKQRAMVFNSATSASSGALSLKQTLGLVNIRLANARGTKNSELALELCGDADATLCRIKGSQTRALVSSKKGEDRTLSDGVATSFIDLVMLQDSSGCSNKTQANYKRRCNGR